MKKGCKTVLTLLVGMVLGVVLFIGSIALTIYIVLTSVSVGDLQDYAGVEIFDKENEVVDKTLWDIIEKVIENSDNFGSMTLNDIQRDYGIKIPDKIDFVDITPIKDVPLKDLKDNLDKLLDKVTLADLTDKFNVNLPKNIQVINDNKDKPVIKAWNAIMDEMDGLTDKTLGELDDMFSLGIYKEGANIHKAMRTLRDKKVGELSDAFNKLLITDILDIFEYALAETVSSSAEATHVFVSQYEDGFVYVSDDDGAYYLTNERYRLLSDTELTEKVTANSAALYIKVVMVTYSATSPTTPVQTISYIPYDKNDANHKTMVSLSYEEATALSGSETLYVWNGVTGVFEAYSGILNENEEYYAKKAMVYEKETAATPIFYEKWDKSKGTVDRYTKRYADEILLDFKILTADSGLNYDAASLMVLNTSNNEYVICDAALPEHLTADKFVIIKSGAVDLYDGKEPVSAADVSVSFNLFDEGGEVYTDLSKTEPAYLKQAGALVENDGQPVGANARLVKVTREASARALISMKHKGTDISTLDSAISDFALNELLDIQPDTILDLPHIRNSKITEIGEGLTDEIMEAKLADVLVWGKDSDADPIATYLLDTTRLIDVLDAMYAELNTNGDDWFSLKIDMKKLNKRFNYIINVVNNTSSSITLGTVVISANDSMTQSVIGNHRG
ncbi:MAG: hypothetical protein LBT55_05025 [Clostridiaceae bacterium]|jgi:hypothetical protein|nr:hypothetical protein [Clostridiaceae bacterium]